MQASLDGTFPLGATLDAELLNRPSDLDFDGLDSGNGEPRGIWMDDDTIWIANDGFSGNNKIFAYNRSNGNRATGKDFNNLDSAGNQDIAGIWSDGDTMFVVDTADDEVYAYKMKPAANFGDRDTTKEFSLHADNDAPRGIWGDDDTIWIANDGFGAGNKVFAYKRASTLGDRDATKDFDTPNAAGNTDLAGIWSDGDTMFVVDTADDKVFAYVLSSRERDSELDSLLEPESGYPYGVWSDGDVMYVLDRSDEEIYAHWLPQRPAVNTPATGRPSIQGITQQGKTLTVDTGAVMDANGLERVSYTYQWIRVDGSDADIDGATSATYTPTAEDVGKKLKVRVAFHDDDGFAETRTSSATILVQGTISGCSEGDLNCSGSGPANVRAIPGPGFVRVFWDAPPAPNLIGDDARTEVYQYEIHRAVDGGATGLLACVEPDPRRYDDIAVETGKSYRYQVRANYYPSDACARERDIDLGINDNTVYSIWSNGEIMWVAAEWDDDNLLAYDLETGDRRAGDDITLRSGQSGSMTSGLTGHGEYVLKGSDSPLNFSAYLISDGSYDSSKSADLTGNQRPSTADATDPGDPYYGTAYNGALTGIWRSLAADETTVWATNISRRVFFAYKRSDGTRDPGRDIIIPDGHPTLAQTEGWWLDEAADVMYFMGLTVDDRVFAFDLDKSTVDDTLTVNLNSWQNTNGGVWSDGDIIWVSHNDTTTKRDQLIGYPLLPGRQHSNWAQSAAATAVGEYGELLVKNTAQPELASMPPSTCIVNGRFLEAGPEVQHWQRLPGLPADKHWRSFRR